MPSPSSARRRPSVLVLAAAVLAALLPVLPGAGPYPPAAGALVPPPQGYWLVASDGGVFGHGGARFFGSTGAIRLNQPIVGMAGTPSNLGYWLVASDGGIFAFGDAGFHGSTGAITLNKPIVGMASTPSGKGYWLVASDGGIFAFGDAAFHGSTGAITLNKPIVGMASTPSGRGYWLVASDGGVFAFGDAAFYGSTGSIALNKPIVGMAATPSNQGYWMVASDGGMFAFGDAAFFGSAVERGGERRVVSLAPTPTGRGYHQATDTGEVLAFGDAAVAAAPARLNQRIVGLAAMRPALSDAPAGDDAGDVPLPTLPTPTTTVPPPVDRGRPNVLLIVMDDQRADQTLDVMPRTRRWFAEEGTTFVEGYANTPLCCPERATIFSGRYMHNHGVVQNGQASRLDQKWTMQRYLHDAGYTTALVGKFLDGWSEHSAPPHFDRFAITGGGYVDSYFNVNGEGDKAGYSTDFIAEKTVEFLGGFEADDSRPWYLHVTPHAPHDSGDGNFYWPERHNDVPLPAWEPSPASPEDDRSDKVDYLHSTHLSQETARKYHDGQLRTLLAADEMVDAIFTHLAATGELDNTLAVFTSDNGYSWGERAVGSKGLPYVESVKVPFLVRWSGVFPAGAVDQRPVGGVDLLPTILDATRTAPATFGYPLDGRSFLPSSPGTPRTPGHPGRDRILLEFEADHRDIPPWASLRNGNWQYVEYYEADTATVHFREYYDLVADPWQLDNLLADADPANDPDVSALSAELARARGCAGTDGPAPCP